MKLEKFIKKFISSDTEFELCIDHESVKRENYQKYYNGEVESIAIRDGKLRIYVSLAWCHYDPKTETFVEDNYIVECKRVAEKYYN